MVMFQTYLSVRAYGIGLCRATTKAIIDYGYDVIPNCYEPSWELTDNVEN